LESVPGLAKTTAARVVAESIHGSFQRIQCTPDLLPSDIIGTQIYEVETHSFATQLGPVHTNILLLDEINRSSAKTQSAMLEAMEERQTTIAGTVYPIPEPFLVIATQNPIEMDGTYRLPEAQLDRFLMRLRIKEILRYPSPEEEIEVIGRIDAGVYDRNRRGQPVVGLDDMRRLQAIVRNVHMDPALIRYASELVAVTRDPAQYLGPQLARLIEYGASPRATIAFAKCARALAVLSGRDHVIPDDVRRLAHRVLRHRLLLGFEAATAKVTTDDVVDAVLQAVRVP
jgi:MoxR-like ATPase